MPFKPVSTGPYAPSTPNTSTGHNNAIGQYGTAINTHTHDPSDTVGNYGNSIPAWGSANPLYSSHGPGATGTDWGTAYNGQAAIPADPNETAVNPSTNGTITQGTTGNFSAAWGVHGELARLRGALALLKGSATASDSVQSSPAPTTAQVAVANGAQFRAGQAITIGGVTGTCTGVTGNLLAISGFATTPAVGALVSQSYTRNWYDTVSIPVMDAAGNVTAGGALYTTEVVITATGTGVAPFSVPSNATATVTNLSADMVDGLHAGTSYGAGSAGSLLALNTDGLFYQGAVDYDGVEATSFDTLASGSTLVNNLNRIRSILAGIALAAGQPNWYTTPLQLTAGLAAQGSPYISGPTTIQGRNGIVASQDGSLITLSYTGSGPDTPGGATYGDLFNDAVVSGLQVSAGTGLAVNIATGIAYVNGARAVLLNAINNVAVTASQTNWIYWTGSTTTVLTGATQPATPAGSILLAEVVAGASSVTTVTDLRTMVTKVVPGQGGGGSASAATTTTLGTVKVDNNASGTPTAVTQQGLAAGQYAQASPGNVSAGPSYGTNEQSMLQAAYQALRTNGWLQ